MTADPQPYTKDTLSFQHTKRGSVFAITSIAALSLPAFMLLAVALGYQAVWLDIFRIALGVAIPVIVIIVGGKLVKSRALREPSSLYVFAIVIAAISLLFGLAQFVFVGLALILIAFVGV